MQRKGRTLSQLEETDDIVRCDYGDGKRARHTLRVESQGVLVVCTPCKELLETKNKKVRCQYCGVPIKDDWKKSALPRFEHVPNCPRSDKVILEVG